MYQRITIIGNLGRDPEMRYTPSGQAVTNLSVATNRRWQAKDGTTREQAVWWRVSVWGKQAEACNQYLSKGRLVLIEGRVRPDDSGNPRVFQRNDGSWGASFELNAQTVKFLGGRTSAPPAESAPSVPDGEGNELPF